MQHFVETQIVDLHDFGALAGGVQALLLSHQPLKGDTCEGKYM